MSEDDPETLRERVRELEQTADDLRETVAELQQRRGPSRRDLLKVGSGGLLGAGLLASSQPVSAAPASADTSAGQVGVAGDSTDVVLDQLRDPGGDEILNVDDSGGINAQFGRTWYFDSVDADSVAIADTLATQGLGYTMAHAVPRSDPSDTSSTTFDTIADMIGGVPPLNEVPGGATLQANLVVNASSVPSGETATYVAEVAELDIGGGFATNYLSSVEVSVSDANTAESGWTAISSDISGSDRVINARHLDAKVSGGTLSSEGKYAFALLFRWVVD